MSLKSSFATVLRTLRSKRNISQRDFGDTSRTFLSKLEGGRSSLTLDKLDQISQRLELSPLTLLTLTLSLEAGKPAVELIDHLRSEIEGLERDGGLPGLEHATRGITARAPRRSQNPQGTQTLQAELCFTTSLHGGKAPYNHGPSSIGIHFRGLQFSRMGDFGACEASLIHISRAQVNLSRAG